VHDDKLLLPPGQQGAAAAKLLELRQQKTQAARKTRQNRWPLICPPDIQERVNEPPESFLFLFHAYMQRKVSSHTT
jgi:hypothetical protein